MTGRFLAGRGETKSHKRHIPSEDMELVKVLRGLFRHYQALLELRREHGVQEVTDPQGRTWGITDLERIYNARVLLPPRQRQSFELFLIADMREQDAAVAMGLSPTNPVGAYVTDALASLIRRVREGEIPGVTEIGEQ